MLFFITRTGLFCYPLLMFSVNAYRYSFCLRCWLRHFSFPVVLGILIVSSVQILIVSSVPLIPNTTGELKMLQLACFMCQHACPDCVLVCANDLYFSHQVHVIETMNCIYKAFS